ncbi:MAG TPA: AAA family ATPase [Candidatus Paceibacterota bacterium]|nr:AAA family ATPase [Candidatus Paceibacterota bacterium]
MLKRLEIAGFKSFARKTVLDFSSSVTAIVGPNGSGKSNVAEAFRFALGEQSMKSMRGKRSEDLIFSGSHSASRANRASVAVTFDNAKKPFKVDFDEVTLERAVFRDGASEYSVNGSKVRLRDTQEILASANIGETGHHIISQGEADRILLANTKERRAMLEDALGLTAFEFKKEESKRKLEKTEENMKQVEALRRELTPHLKFLTTQVEKLERADELRRQLAEQSAIYFATEEHYLSTEKEKAAHARAVASEKLAALTAELNRLDDTTADSAGMKKAQAVRDAERDLDRLVAEKAALARDIGKAEGALEAAKQRSAAAARDPYVKVSRDEFTMLRDEIEKQVEHAGEVPDSLKAALQAIRGAIRAFFERFALPKDAYLADEEQAVYKLEEEHQKLAAKDAALAEIVERMRHELSRAREDARAHEEAGREGKKELVKLADERAQATAEVAHQGDRERELVILTGELEQARAEVAALIGSLMLSTEGKPVMGEERAAQEGRKRAIERLKIRLEESGGTGEEVRTEYKEATEREAFLGRELTDLAQSAEGLRTLIKDLDDELAKNFAEGLKKVNDSFTEFFALMFGGGSAKLTLEEFDADEEEDDLADDYEPRKKDKDAKPGIEISVNLPKKKVQSLMQLSGGERALTSIALIFAMSQVNPPPFLILDETDAALDEANSRRYGDMIENLAKKSQLIVITHNRETMSRAGILYGVTMGADGVSKLLSVKFDEAVAVAK